VRRRTNIATTQWHRRQRYRNETRARHARRLRDAGERNDRIRDFDAIVTRAAGDDSTNTGDDGTANDDNTNGGTATSAANLAGANSHAAISNHDSITTDIAGVAAAGAIDLDGTATDANSIWLAARCGWCSDTVGRPRIADAIGATAAS